MSHQENHNILNKIILFKCFEIDINIIQRDLRLKKTKLDDMKKEIEDIISKMDKKYITSDIKLFVEKVYNETS